MVGNLPHSEVGSARPDPSGPVRTCIGCRERAAKSELVRVVVVRDTATQVAVPDHDSSAAGRGAHLHPTSECLELAERRRAFARTLRLQGHVDVTVLRAYVRTRSEDHDDQTAPPDAVTEQKRSTSS